MSIFNSVLVKKPGRSLFNLTHERKFSCDWSYLYPICCLEAVPGDTFKLATEFLIRTAPLVAPVMHKVNVKVNYFFVPNRLLWSEWQDFITGINQQGTYDPTSTDQSNYFVTKVPPFVKITSASSINTYLSDGSLADFLGYPTKRPSATGAPGVDGVVVQLLPFRAYQKIYNDWFRNQNVEAEPWSSTSGGQVSSQIAQTLLIRKRMWEKDYFTSCLPFAQRGDPVQIPFTQNFSVGFNPTASGQADTVYSALSGAPASAGSLSTNANGDLQQGSTKVTVDNSDKLVVNGGVTLGTINDLRIATKLQKWLEVNARVGGRYIEQILGHFGIHSSDARLDRSEYLGGFSAPIVVSDVEQTSATVSNSPQANLAGKGTSYNYGKPVKCFCEEHGFIIGILSIIPRTTYQDGLPRMFQRNYKEDYYFPEFANLGEQEVNKAELFYDLTNESNRSFNRFGFQERYCEYKYIPSTVHGEFKNNLQFWHLGRSFSSQPALNKDFVECNPRTNIFAVESGVSHFYVNLVNHITALRPMPKQAIPSL